ncbi:hypothetical protein VF14_02630 [Nostoc linckia z18]|uniref:Uncharacterized protein n=2 Tax=Nostoc linckia TaxID=92942 RepID=A0A9Q6EJK3_NOSLI|nr:hypothetical protein [Nostoc linckia]PHK41777.1 hypothetical protein VF12_05185 [Nostoc linckia z15]PHK45846.1 hypothetical protein VF13_14360 [Nostoc linckia z16]PHJ69060.1 hypothetical protein VF02_00105 [Nostoc linckia z1]PHJ73211.1 hypothetical protein VF05_01120 [Nostoc linckia z3]PHJ78558.1 hypothetical protein VF03_00105 [Nostoc linckia z2]
MSIYKNSIKAFIEMLDSQSNLIPISDWEELQQISTQLPEDDEEISEIIEEWLKRQSCSELLEAYKQNLKSISAESPINVDINIGIGNSKSQTPANQPSESSKQLIENSIKNNSPSSDNTKTNQK